MASEREADDLLNRDSEARYDTPRRYEEGAAEEDARRPAGDTRRDHEI